MKKRILVIDDDSSILNVLTEALEYKNYEVKTLDTIENIFTNLESFDPNVILIDFIRESIKRGRNLPSD